MNEDELMAMIESVGDMSRRKASADMTQAWVANRNRGRQLMVRSVRTTLLVAIAVAVAVVSMNILPGLMCSYVVGDNAAHPNALCSRLIETLDNI